MRNGRVLIVDDDVDSRVILGTLLEHGGYSVMSAATRRQAGLLLSHDRPDVVLLNVSLWRTGGHAAAPAVREERGWAGVPVIGLMDERDLAHAPSLSAEGYCGVLTKPVSPGLLWAAVAHCSARAGVVPGWVDFRMIHAVPAAASRRSGG